MRNVMIGLVCAALLSGCITWSAPWYANPAKSSGRIEIREKGEEFKLDIIGDGDGKFLQSFHYQGQGEDPWLMTVNAETDITSPALTITAQAVATAAEQIPGLMEQVIPLIGPFPDESGNQIGWVQLLFGFLSEHPGFLTEFIGLIFGAG